MFQENQYVKIKVDDHPYHGPIKRMCQTFFRNPELSALYNGNWQPISMHTIEEKRPMRHITTAGNRELFVTDDQLIMTPGEKCKFAKDLSIGDKVSLEKSICDGQEEDEIVAVLTVGQAGDWLFTIRVINISAPYFALENGIICRGEL